MLSSLKSESQPFVFLVLFFLSSSLGLAFFPRPLFVAFSKLRIAAQDVKIIVILSSPAFSSQQKETKMLSARVWLRILNHVPSIMLIAILIFPFVVQQRRSFFLVYNLEVLHDYTQKGTHYCCLFVNKRNVGVSPLRSAKKNVVYLLSDLLVLASEVGFQVVLCLEFHFMLLKVNLRGTLNYIPF